MKTNSIAAELNRIAKANGGELRPKDVVNAARPKTSPLHSRFTWDDTKAAEAHRLWQARQLISVTVTYIKDEQTRCFVSLSTDRTKRFGGYRATVAVLSSAEMRKQLLEDARLEMVRFQQKYSALEELANVFSAMRSALAKTGPKKAA